MSDPADILAQAAQTFRARNAVYKDNYKIVGAVMEALHGTTKLEHAADYEIWHLWELLIVKLTRFAVSGLKHQDSIHDIAVYAAMIESIISNDDADAFTNLLELEEAMKDG